MKSYVLKYIIGILCIIMLTGSVYVYSDSVTVSRDMPKTANISSEVTVSLNLNATGKETSGIIIKEAIPGGWSVSSVSNEGSFYAETNEIKWIFYGENVKSQTLSYIGFAPSKPDNYTFSGTYTTLEGGVGEITGDEKISIGIIETKKSLGEVKEEEREGYDTKIIIGLVAVVFIIALIIFILIKRKKK